MLLTEDKITAIFVMADEFCKVFDAMLRRRGLSEPRNDRKRDYHRDCRMSQAEIMVIMIMFHSSNHKCLKHFYLNEICVRYRHLFPDTVSYGRFTELEKSIVVQFVIFVKKCLVGNVPESALWTAPCCGCAATSVSTCTRFSRDWHSAANAL